MFNNQLLVIVAFFVPLDAALACVLRIIRGLHNFQGGVYVIYNHKEAIAASCCNYSRQEKRMKMAKKIFLLVFVSLMSLLAAAQNGVGDWRLHVPFVGTNVKSVVETRLYVYYLAGDNLFRSSSPETFSETIRVGSGYFVNWTSCNLGT